MSKTKFRVLAAALMTMLAITEVHAQTEPVAKDSAQQKATPATIAEMTKLARELRVETLKKELRDAKEEKKPTAVGDVLQTGMPAPAARPVRVLPQPPVVQAIYGTGGVLRARLASGQDVQPGSRTGVWRVTAIEVGGVNFERCEPVRKGSKKAECESQFVAPSNNG